MIIGSHMYTHMGLKYRWWRGTNGMKWVWQPRCGGLNTHLVSTNTLPFQMCDGGRLNDLFLKISCATSISSLGEILDEDDEYIV